MVDRSQQCATGCKNFLPGLRNVFDSVIPNRETQGSHFLKGRVIMVAEPYLSLRTASERPRTGWASRASVTMEKTAGATRRPLARPSYLISRHSGMSGNSILGLSLTAQCSLPNSKNDQFDSCTLRSKTLVFSRFFAFPANCFGFPARPWTCMLAGAASSSESPESPQNPRFPEEHRWFCSRGGRIRISLWRFCDAGFIASCFERLYKFQPINLGSLRLPSSCQFAWADSYPKTSSNS